MLDLVTIPLLPQGQSRSQSLRADVTKHTRGIPQAAQTLNTILLRSTKENAFIVRSDFENFGPFIDTDLAPPKNSSGAKLFREIDVIFIGHVLNLVLRLSLLCLLNEVAMCFVSTRSSVSICLASWCASLFSLTFSSRLVYFLVEFWTLLPCLFYMFTITIA